MKSILIISAVFPPEPVVSASLTKSLAEELENTQRKVTVLCPQPSRPSGYDFSKYIDKNIQGDFRYNVIRIDSFMCPKSDFGGRLRESISFGKGCSSYIEANHDNIDAIYVNSWPLFAQKFVVKTAKKHNIPCIVHVMDIYPESLINKLKIGKKLIYSFLVPIDKYTLQNAKRIICISQNMQDLLAKTRKINAGKFVLVPNWQDENEYINQVTLDKERNIDSSALTFMYLGNNGPVAGVELLIRSFVSAKINNSRLVIAGDGSRKNACMKLSESLHADNIEFVSVPDGDVPKIQAGADIMLLPVKKNGAMSSIPSKLSAYMFSSKPIIGSLDLQSDTAKAIIDAECGIVVEPENEDVLTNAMIEMSNWSKHDLVLKGKNAFNYAMLNFSKTENLKKITKIFDSL